MALTGISKMIVDIDNDEAEVPETARSGTRMNQTQ